MEKHVLADLKLIESHLSLLVSLSLSPSKSLILLTLLKFYVTHLSLSTYTLNKVVRI